MPALPFASPPNAKSGRARFLVRGLRSAGFGVVIAVLLTAAFGAPFYSNLVQSVCIATMCWFATDLLRLSLAKRCHRHAAPGSPEAARHWPGRPLVVVVAIVVGTLFGFSVGNEPPTGHSAALSPVTSRAIGGQCRRS